MPHTWGPKAGNQFRPASPSPRAASAAGPAHRPAPAVRAHRVLFVCLGNSCRSQMAEGFARHYGVDVMEVASAGLTPASMVAPLSAQAMRETKGIDLASQWPKSIFDLPGPWDLIVNMSGYPLPPGVEARQVRTWTVPDPVADPLPVHCQVANQIESMVQQLILEFRAAR